MKTHLKHEHIEDRIRFDQILSDEKLASFEEVFLEQLTKLRGMKSNIELPISKTSAFDKVRSNCAQQQRQKVEI